MRLSQLDKVLASLEADRAVLDVAIAKLRAQQAAWSTNGDLKPARVRPPRVPAATDADASLARTTPSMSNDAG